MPKTKSSRKAYKPRSSVLTKRIDEDSKEAVLYALNREQSPLLRLPAELPLMIYEHAFGDKTILVKHKAPEWRKRQRNGIKEWVRVEQGGFYCIVFDGDINPFMANAWCPTEWGWGGLSLLSGVCRQLYEETATLPFEWSVFAFSSHYALNRYIWKERRLPLFQRRAIKNLIVPEYRPSATMEKYLGGLNKVRVDTPEYIMEHDQKSGKTSKVQKTEEQIRNTKRMKPYMR